MTAWIDGALPAREQVEFENSLGDGKPRAERERQETRQLGGLLRSHLKTPPMANPDFFNHELLCQIEAERPKPQPARASGGFPFWRFAWATASCAGAATVLFISLAMPVAKSSTHPKSDYFAQIFDTQPGDSKISAVAFHSTKENVTVLWLDGLDYVPTEGHK